MYNRAMARFYNHQTTSNHFKQLQTISNNFNPKGLKGWKGV